MKQTYFKLLSGIIAVLALLVFSAYVVSAEGNNNDNNSDYHVRCEDQSKGYRDEHRNNDCNDEHRDDNKCYSHEGNELDNKDDHVNNDCSREHRDNDNDGEDENNDDGDETHSTPTPTPTVTPTPTPSATPVATQTPSNNGGGSDGKSDGLGCGSHDCSESKVAGAQSVLGASTGPQVLGLSTTSGENELLQLAQAFGTLVFSGLGLAFYKKSA